MKITHDLPTLPSGYEPKPGSTPAPTKFKAFLLEKMDGTKDNADFLSLMNK